MYHILYDTQYRRQGLFLRSQRFFGAEQECDLFGIGQFGRRVEREVEPGRHFAGLDHFGDVFGVFLRMVPLGKIQVAAALIYISRGEPGYGSDVGIEAPPGLIAMAIEAGAAHEVARFGRIPGRLFGGWRIGMIVAERDELDHDGSEEEPFEQLQSHTESILVRVYNGG